MTLTARPGDFDFLAGTWHVRNRRLKVRWTTTPEWEDFDGSARCWTVLGGLGSIEELCIPSDAPRGLGIRLLDLERGQWSDTWCGRGHGLIAPSPAWGGFADGAGTFVCTDELDGDIPIHVRGVWDRITPDSCRWHQAFSRDGGQTWEDNWFMDWTRVQAGNT